MTKISVKVIPRASKNEVECTSALTYTVRLTAPPVDDKANALLIKLLAKHFGIAPSLLRVVSGEKSKKKVIEMP
ncbi:MAG: DUF167 domain-containing protein [Candidatus Moranbacteria bacterium]|nr:DUF167 domain-containing protein [Candidatus Moranbacteria bacterium]OIQ02714.1 MAG: hypothetical protein AUK58_02690 [Candidatus Moranbacteria bacterium CG2_30_41_165]PIP25801.1 MAG: hypothetical protein COX32_01455 [Candidatus Moranbacteria bacterium CG23_combo_of_CG06-09_8_20_14_all_41_28]PIV86501.1 MAG: hypothetical protein COW50_01030 [Candidatus Moranbacteria bacterium CG17_big_fil_post_rev_8_21_14_2_50_41_107]PIW93693.1 MAG: hypothetical protein COZ86_05010 [Candidatus Moranbacteria b